MGEYGSWKTLPTVAGLKQRRRGTPGVMTSLATVRFGRSGVMPAGAQRSMTLRRSLSRCSENLGAQAGSIEIEDAVRRAFVHSKLRLNGQSKLPPAHLNEPGGAAAGAALLLATQPNEPAKSDQLVVDLPFLRPVLSHHQRPSKRQFARLAGAASRQGL